jgi:hypothetical protein
VWNEISFKHAVDLSYRPPAAAAGSSSSSSSSGGDDNKNNGSSTSNSGDDNDNEHAHAAPPLPLLPPCGLYGLCEPDVRLALEAIDGSEAQAHPGYTYLHAVEARESILQEVRRW